jgi:hypothetical protein
MKSTERLTKQLFSILAQLYWWFKRQSTTAANFGKRLENYGKRERDSRGL